MMCLLQLIESGNKEKVEETIVKNGIPIDSTWTDYMLLRSAVRKGHVGIAKYLIEQGCRVNNTGKSELNTLLHIAVKDERTEIIKLLLENGAAVEVKNCAGETPLSLAIRTNNEEIMDLVFQRCSLEELHTACVRNRLDIINKSIRSGVSVNKPVASNSPSWPNYTPLHLALDTENFAIVERLLENGADVNAKNPKGMTALHVAVRQNNIWMVQKLLGSGAELSAKNPEGMTALHMAAQQNNQPIIDRIFKIMKESSLYDNVTDDRNFSYFHIACMMSNPFIVEGFLKNGVEFNGQVSNESDIWPGYTPLHLAVEHGDIEIAKLLLEHGADISLKNKKGQTPLHLAATENKHPIGPIKKMVDLIVSSQKNCSKFLNQIDNHGFSHFHAVCLSDNWKAVLALLEEGEDVNQSVKADAPKWPRYTPLHFALEYSCEETAKVLLKHGADIHKTSDEHPLIKAMRNMSTTIVDMLLGMGADVNYCIEGLSLLHCAVLISGPEMVELLIERKADVNCVQTGSLMTPLHYAVRNFAFETVEILLRGGADANARTVVGDTVLHFLRENYVTSRIDTELVDAYSKMIISIIDAGGDINVPNRSGWTPLYQASCYGYYSVFYALLINGAEINVGSSSDRVIAIFPSSEMQGIFDTHKLKMSILKSIYMKLKDAHRIKLKDLPHKYIKNIHKLNEKDISFRAKFVQNAFLNTCASELTRMQYIEIDKYTTLYDIIFENPTALAFRVLKQSFKETLELEYFDKVFPLYGFLIRQQSRKGIAMLNHVNSAKRALETLSTLGLPDPCTESIIKHLNKQDLKNLISAATKSH